MFSSHATDDLVSLEQWRAHLLSWFIQVIFVFSWLVGLPNLLVVSLNSHWHLIAIHAFALAWVSFLFFKRKTNASSLSTQILIGLYIFGLANLVYEAWLALTYLIVLPIAAALLLHGCAPHQAFRHPKMAGLEHQMEPKLTLT